MLHPYLLHLQVTLTSNTRLRSLVPSDNIAATGRQPAKWPSLEYGIDPWSESDVTGKFDGHLIINVYSGKGASECAEIYEALKPSMTATKLSKQGIFVSDQVKLLSAQGLPQFFSDWVSALRCEFHVRGSFALPTGPLQKQ